MEKKVDVEVEYIAGALPAFIKRGVDRALRNQNQRVILYREVEHSDPFTSRAALVKHNIVHGLPVGGYNPIQFQNNVFESVDLKIKFEPQSLVQIDDAISCITFESFPVLFQYFLVR